MNTIYFSGIIQAMPLLYYWRGDNYKKDIELGAGYHLNQANPALHDISAGESLWAFTRRLEDGAYVMAAELVAIYKTLNPAGYQYGRYRLWGNLNLSRYFAVESQPDISVLVKSLAIPARGNVLGQAFQGLAAVRRISCNDDKILRKYAEGLSLEPRAKLLPEEQLEALLLAGDANAIEKLIREQPVGVAEERSKYLINQAVDRNRQFSECLRDTYQGRCQICGWAPREIYGKDVCEAHHVRWLSRGGEDQLSNIVLICPNHHRAIHRLDAAFDWEVMGFRFNQTVEPLQLMDHVLQAS